MRKARCKTGFFFIHISMLNFRTWLVNEIGGATSVVFDPKQKSRDWNWMGAPGSTGVSPKENPIGVGRKKKKKKKKKK